MSKLFPMHDAQSSQDLDSDLLCTFFWNSVLNMTLQVTLREIFRSEEDRIVVIIPTKEIDEDSFLPILTKTFSVAS